MFQLDVSNNRLRSIDASTLDWPNVGRIDFQMNPWLCDCSAQWMLDQLLPILYNNTPSLLYYFRYRL